LTCPVPLQDEQVKNKNLLPEPLHARQVPDLIILSLAWILCCWEYAAALMFR
jgi:hypothetical protein